MAAPRRRTERSESAAERARKAPRPTDSRRTFTLYHFPRPAYTLPRRFLLTAFAYRRARLF